MARSISARLNGLPGLTFKGEITPRSAEGFDDYIKQYVRKYRSFIVWLNSGGGTISAAEAMCRTLDEALQVRPDIFVIVDRFCGSCALDVLITPPRDNRVARAGATFFFHSSRTVRGSKTLYTAKTEMPLTLSVPKGMDRDGIEALYRTQERLIARRAQRTRLSESQVRRRMQPSGKSFNASQAKRDGIIGHIL